MQIVLATDDLALTEGYRGHVIGPATPTTSSRKTNALLARLLTVPPALVDAAIACAVLLWVLNSAATDTPRESIGPALLLGAAAVSLAWRRRYSLPVLAVTLVAYGLAPHTGIGQPAMLVALYTVASVGSVRDAVISAVIAAAVSVAAIAAHGDGSTLALGRVLAVAVAALVGLGVAEQRRRRDHEQLMLAERAAAEERVTIARELHDVIAHHLSVIVVQANLVGETIDPEDPAFGPAQSVIAAGRQALADMRRVLGVLRTYDEPEARIPQPGLANLDALIERVSSTGLDVDLTIKGDAVELSAGLDVSVYRIVQEALTNVLRHAHAAHAGVRVQYSPSLLTLEVSDDGTGRSPNASAHTGHGIAGMRERVALFDGELVTGPNPARGYIVRAELPL